MIIYGTKIIIVLRLANFIKRNIYFYFIWQFCLKLKILILYLPSNLSKMEVNNCVITKEFTDHLAEKGILTKEDYFQITKLCKATRHHIKSVIEKHVTTNKEVYDVIIAYFAQKLKNLAEQKELISESA